MKKRQLVAALMFLGTTSGLMAQKKDFSYKFYGQVRTDLFYNSRANVESVDGLFYMFPKDIQKDKNGKDLNGRSNSSFYALYTRLGLDVKGPDLWNGRIKTSAKVEADFRGSGSSFSTVRLRHAFVNLDFGTSALLLGQTWHPLYGTVAPEILNLNMGAPYQPFSRAPQIRYQYTGKNFVVTAAALWQSQYLSVGPDSDEYFNKPYGSKKSQNFIKNSCIPEFYLGIDFKNQHWIVGAGAHISSLMPHSQIKAYDSANLESQCTLKVDSRITGLTGEFHMKYKSDKWLFAAKSVLSSNLTQTSTVGGYGIKTFDIKNGIIEYTPIRVSHSWFNLVYGKKLRAGIFGGYLKNLGTKDETAKMNPNFENLPPLFGTGTSVDQLITGTAELTYNLPHWKFGLEYSWAGALYGTNTQKAKVENTHTAKNNRVVFTTLFQF